MQPAWIKERKGFPLGADISRQSGWERRTRRSPTTPLGSRKRTGIEGETSVSHFRSPLADFTSFKNRQSDINNYLHVVLIALHRVFPQLEVFQVNAGSSGDAGQRVLSQTHVQSCCVADNGREPAEQ